jgi:hypothetical protein
MGTDGRMKLKKESKYMEKTMEDTDYPSPQSLRDLVLKNQEIKKLREEEKQRKNLEISKAQDAALYYGFVKYIKQTINSLPKIIEEDNLAENKWTFRFSIIIEGERSFRTQQRRDDFLVKIKEKNEFEGYTIGSTQSSLGTSWVIRW